MIEGKKKQLGGFTPEPPNIFLHKEFPLKNFFTIRFPPNKKVGANFIFARKKAPILRTIWGVVWEKTRRIQKKKK